LSPSDRGGAGADDGLLLAAVRGDGTYGIAALDPSGCIRAWNDGAARMTGYTEDEVVGRGVELLFPSGGPETRAAEWQLAVALADGTYEDEGWRLRKDGSQFWASTSLTALRDEDGRFDGFSLVVRDRTERKQAEDLLRESEERFALLVRAVTDYAIFLLDTEGRVASWNLGAERLKGYRADEIIGRHFSTFYQEVDRRAGIPAAGLQEAFDRGRWECEGWRIRKDGTRFWANVVITCLRGHDGTHLGYAKVTRDLTDRKRNEDALRGILDREREAAARLRELDEAKTEFVASVAHDLRSPVGVLRTVLELLEDDWDTSPEEQRRMMLARARRRAEQLASFVDDVFDLARMDAGVLRVGRDEIDVVAIAKDVTADIEVVSPDRAVELSADGDCRACGDLQRTTQIVANLVSNAAKFSPADATIRLAVQRRGDEVVVSVTDEGPGIPDDEAPQLFRRFTRLTNAVGTSGSGLGLFIARSLVQAQGGRLWLERTGPSGSVFAFTLPAAA
jgi:PAS domain S-box-containing protein